MINAKNMGGGSMLTIVWEKPYSIPKNLLKNSLKSIKSPIFRNVDQIFCSGYTWQFLKFFDCFFTSTRRKKNVKLIGREGGRRIKFVYSRKEKNHHLLVQVHCIHINLLHLFSRNCFSKVWCWSKSREVAAFSSWGSTNIQNIFSY